MGRPRPHCSIAVALVFAAALCRCGAEEEAPPAATEEPAKEEASDETKELLNQLTISMASEVVDGRSFIVRDAAAKTGRRKLLVRLGNVQLPDRGSLDEEQHQAKLDKAKGALAKLVEKQMIWWKAAPDEHQPPAPEGAKPEEVPMLADVWLIDGRHVSGLLKTGGHLTHVEEYHSELARDILTAEADAKKKDAYKELEKAMKESDKERKKAAAEAAKKAAEDEPGEPLGIAGWLGIGVLAIIVIGAMLNFGRAGAKKKVNYNKKKGAFESFWTKLKGS